MKDRDFITIEEYVKPFKKLEKYLQAKLKAKKVEVQCKLLTTP